MTTEQDEEAEREMHARELHPGKVCEYCDHHPGLKAYGDNDEEIDVCGCCVEPQHPCIDATSEPTCAEVYAAARSLRHDFYPEYDTFPIEGTAWVSRARRALIAAREAVGR